MDTLIAGVGALGAAVALDFYAARLSDAFVVSDCGLRLNDPAIPQALHSAGQ